jgi:hypothetical protein
MTKMCQHYLNSLGVWGPWDVEGEGDEALHEGQEILQYPCGDQLLWRQAQHLLHYHTECELFSSKENTHRQKMEPHARRKVILVSESHPFGKRFMQRVVTA